MMPLKPKKNISHKWLEHPFIHYIKIYKGSFALGTIALVFTNAFDILSPYLIGKIIDALATATFKSLSLDLFLLLCVSFGTALFRYLWRIYFGYFHHNVAADLRKTLFSKMLNLGQDFHHKVPTGEKMTLITQDVDNFRMGIGPGLLIFFDAIIYVIAIIPLMMMIDVHWTLYCLALMPLVPFVVYKLESLLTLSYRNLQDQNGEMTSFSQETVSGIKVIKSLGLSRLRSHLFHPTNKKLQDYGIKVDKIESIFGPTLEFFMMIGTATLLFVGAKKMVSGEVSVGHFFAFYQYLQRMIWPMTALGFSFMMYKEADSSFDRIKNVLEKDDWIDDGHVDVTKGKTLQVKNLSFKYLTHPIENKISELDNITENMNLKTHSEWTLKNINFTLGASESMAIVGSVGSGKSTLVQLLARHLPTTEGQIFYDQHPIDEIKKFDYRKITALVPQKVFLFKKSIEDNILDFADADLASSFNTTLNTDSKNKNTNALGQTLSDDLLKQVHIESEISSMPLKAKTLLEENGQGLSGGQRQRLTLARGLALNPQWLILDDTLSAVDIETEQKIISNLKEKKKLNQMNFIICSHRIQSLDWVDKILVLDQGHIVDIGDHKTLYARCAIYRGLYSSQKESSSVSSESKPSSSQLDKSKEGLI